MMDEKRVSFRAKIKRCTYDNGNNFRIFSSTVDEKIYPEIYIHPIYNTVSLMGDTGELSLDVEYNVVAIEQSRNGNISYKVVNITRDIPQTKDEVYNFLKEILTYSQANVLVEHYPNIIDIVKENRCDEVDLSKLKGIKEKTFAKIVDKISSNFMLVELVSEFKDYISLTVVKKLYNKYSSIEKVREEFKKDAYKCLCGISGIGFKKADAILLKMDKDNVVDFGYDLKSSKQICLAYILYALQENESSGHTKMNLADLRGKCFKDVKECADNFADALKGCDGVYYDVNTMDIALMRTYETEKYIGENVLERLNNNTVWDFDTSKYTEIDGVKLSDEQTNLLTAVCKYNFVVLTAPAGSGKSFSTKAVINMLKDNKKSFTLCSPTGKASKRLSEYIGETANTIHRTLCYTPKEFMYNEYNQLYTDFILVDEVGMTDINLFKSLLKAIPSTTKILLVGDSYQLNSVGCGALLRDLLSCEKIPKVMFTKVFRMGKGGVLTACTYVRQNKKFIYENKITKIGEDESYVFIPSNKNNVNNMIAQLYKQLLEEYSANDISVISCYNVGENGCIALNKLLQPIANPSSLLPDAICLKTKADKEEIKYFVGDLVIQTSNNYHAKVYVENNDEDEDDNEEFIPNGTCGEIKDIKDNKLIINFDDILIVYNQSDLINIKHAFALSTHKLQGSQNKVIIYSSPSSHTYMTTNNIIYTSLSRAEKKVYHFSDCKTLNICMNKSDNVSRKTMLADLLNNN